jgi:hypothetical protein
MYMLAAEAFFYLGEDLGIHASSWSIQARMSASVHRIHWNTHRAVAYVPPRELEPVRRKHGSHEGARSLTPPWEEVKDDEEDDNPHCRL